VEDDDLLRLVASKGLAKKGFSVIEAASGTEAITLLGTYPDRIDAILLDLTVPGISSRVVLEEAQRLRPDVRIILTSAHTRERVGELFPGWRIDQFIRKPYHIADLADMLHDR
jgi:two-component system cell cycle sensor histidine kinase/response regulator CckA